MEDRTAALVQEINDLHELVANAKSLEVIRKMLETKSIREDFKDAIMNAVFANIKKYAPPDFEDVPGWQERFQIQMNAFDCAGRFGWIRTYFEGYVKMADAEADKRDTELESLLTGFWEDVICARGLIANKGSFEEICSALKAPGIPCEAKTYVMEAFFNNIVKFEGAQGTFVTALFKLLKLDAPKVAECLAVLIAKCTTFVKCDEEALAKCSEQHKRAIAEALERNNERWAGTLDPRDDDQPHFFAEWRPQLSGFLKACVKVGERPGVAQKSARSQYIKGLLDTVMSGEKLVVEFVVAEIQACRVLILTPTEFRGFARQLQTSRVIEKEKVLLLKSILDNTTRFGK